MQNSAAFSSFQLEVGLELENSEVQDIFYIFSVSCRCSCVGLISWGIIPAHILHIDKSTNTFIVFSLSAYGVVVLSSRLPAFFSARMELSYKQSSISVS